MQKQLLQKMFIIGLTSSLLIGTAIVNAQSSTPTTTAKPSPSVDDKIKTLKDKLATKVAELRETQTRGFYGSIAQASKTSFTLVTSSGEIKIRYGDDASIFKDTKKTEGAAIDIKNNASAAVLGLYDTQNKEVTAKVIILETLPSFYSGKLGDIDKKNNAVTITSTKNAKLTVDYEKTTTAHEFDRVSGNLIKSGFSRFTTGDQLLIWGTPNEEDQSRISATKILRLTADILGVSTVSASTTPEPTSKTSPKATPKASPEITPKATP